MTETGTETENVRECERAHDRDREAKHHNRERECDMNSLYQIPHEAHLLFGFCTGMDRHEQKKLVAKNEKDMHDQIHKKDGIKEKPEEVDTQCRKEASAKLCDTFDICIKRHWSEKKLEEMMERDCPKGRAWVMATSRCAYRAFICFFSIIKTIFLLKPVVNFIRCNILRQFSGTVLERVS